MNTEITHAQHAARLFADGRTVVVRAHGLPARQFGRVLKVFASGGLLVRCMAERRRPDGDRYTSTRRVRAAAVFHVLDVALTAESGASPDSVALARIAMGEVGFEAAMAVLELASVLDDSRAGYPRAWDRVVSSLAALGAVDAPAECRSGQIVAALHRYATPACVPSRVEAVEASEPVEAAPVARAVPRSEEPEALAAWAALEELEAARAAQAPEPVELGDARALVDEDASDAVARDRKGLAWGLRDAHDGFQGLASWRHLAGSVETAEGWILVSGRRLYVEGDRDEMRAELSARAARLAAREAAQ